MSNLKDLIKNKITLKELTVTSVLKANNHCDMLFITPYGMFHGTPYNDPDDEIMPNIILSNVTIISDSKTLNFNGSINLFCDQIIAAMPVDKDSFLNSLQHPQG